MGSPEPNAGPLLASARASLMASALPSVSGLPSLWSTDATLPPTPSRALLASDPADHEVLLVDEATYSIVSVPPYPGPLKPAAFYTFNGSGWTLLPLENGPAYSSGAAIAYDSARSAVVYILPTPQGDGGFATVTWTFTAGLWSQLSGPPGPPARSFAGASDDPGLGGVLLFGGENSTTGEAVNDTWLLGPSGWSAAPSSGTAPSPRELPALAWDADAGAVVLLGGCTGGPATACGNDTWEFSNGGWAAEVLPGPPLGSGADGPYRYALVETSGPGDVVAVPVGPGNGSLPGSGWVEFNGSAWESEPSPGAPDASNSTGVAELPAPGRFVEFPAPPGSLASNVTTWFGNGTGWVSVGPVEPSARSGAALAYDAADGYLLLTGGSSGGLANGPYLNDSWKYVDGAWSELATNRSPPALYDPGLVYDVHDGYVLLFGGGNAHGVQNDTWEFTRGGWTRVTPRNTPTGNALRDGRLVYDGADGYVVWLGGAPSSAYTWTYQAGNWTNRTNGTQPTGPPANPLVYDAADGYVLDQGAVIETSGGPVANAQTWTFLDGIWTLRNLSAEPPATLDGAVAYDPSPGEVLLFGGTNSSTTGGNVTWIYRGQNWTSAQGPFDPPGVFGGAAAYDVDDASVVLFGGTPGLTYGGGSPSCSTVDGLPMACNETFRWSASADVRPYIETFAAGPSTIDVDRAANLTTSVVGGTGPLRFVYQGLPPGCASTNRSEWTCVPTVTGNFTVSVTVWDAAGHVAGSSTPLNVTAPLAISVFNASPSLVGLAERTLLSVAVTGGTSTVAYDYAGLPPGCTTQSVPTLPCTPSGAGEFRVTVTATDDGGGNVSTALDLTVTPAGPPGGPYIEGIDLRPPALVLGNSTALQINATGGIVPYTYSFSGLPPGCASENLSVLPCAPTASGVYEILFTVRGGNGSVATTTANLTVYPSGGGGALEISSFSVGSGPIEVGQSTVVSVSASSDVGPLRYSFTGLPPGCSPENASTFNCTPTQNGTFRIYALVTDDAGARSGAYATLEVLSSVPAAPAVSLFSAAPRTLHLGGSTVLFVGVDGGVGPLEFSYGGLPSGCASANAPQLNCTPTSTGHFTVVVRVTDALGRTANDSLGLVVLPAEVPTGGSGGPFSGFNAAGLDSIDGALAVGFVVAAAVLLAVTELVVRRTRERTEGRELLAALAQDGPAVGPSDEDSDTGAVR